MPAKTTRRKFNRRSINAGVLHTRACRCHRPGRAISRLRILPIGPWQLVDEPHLARVLVRQRASCATASRLRGCASRQSRSPFSPWSTPERRLERGCSSQPSQASARTAVIGTHARGSGALRRPARWRSSAVHDPDSSRRRLCGRDHERHSGPRLNARILLPLRRPESRRRCDASAPARAPRSMSRRPLAPPLQASSSSEHDRFAHTELRPARFLRTETVAIMNGTPAISWTLFTPVGLSTATDCASRRSSARLPRSGFTLFRGYAGVAVVLGAMTLMRRDA